jgi:hypothetical protein
MKCTKCPCPDICLARASFCQWAAREPVNPVEIRMICDRSRIAGGVPANFPPLTTQARNFAGAMGRAAKAVITGQPVNVPPGVLESRQAACATCDKLKDGRCLLCGCAYQRKIRLATETCPDDPPKWVQFPAAPC